MSRETITVCVWEARDLIDMDAFPKDTRPDSFVHLCVWAHPVALAPATRGGASWLTLLALPRVVTGL